MPTLFGVDPLSPMGIISNGYILGALALSVAVTALSYMAGEFFQMPSLKAFSKVELSELGVTAIILLLAVMLVMPGGGFDMISRGFLAADPMANGQPTMVCDEWTAIHGNYVTDPNSPMVGSYEQGNIAFAQSHYFIGCKTSMWTILGAPTVGQAARVYYSTVVYDMINTQAGQMYVAGKGVMMPKILSGYVHLMWIEVMLGVMSTLDFGLGKPLGQPFVWLNIGGFTPFIGLNLVSEGNIFIVDAVAATWSGFAAQKMLLNFIEAAMLAYFLPLGLLMRSVPFTRKTGSTIIAIVFAAYFVFPTSILLNQRIYQAIDNPPGPAGCKGVGEVCGGNSMCCSQMCRMDSSQLGKCTSPLTDFNEYGSVFQICKDNVDPWTMYDNWNESVQAQKARLEQLAQYREQYTGDPSLANNRLIEGITGQQGYNAWDAGGRDYNTRWSDYSPGEQTQLAPMLFRIIAGSPIEVSKRAFGLFEYMIIDTSKYVVLGLVFIVIEILITLTLVKDFALLIGGEPRIFGLSKLV